MASDDPGAIEAAAAELIEEMMTRNGARSEDLISIVFTSTSDLTSEFPAAGARKLGLAGIPLLCAQELAVDGSLTRCIRVLMHLNTERDYASLRHVYLGEARALRTDLAE